MLDQLEAIRERFDEVSQLISQPEVVSDMKKFTKDKERVERLLEKIVEREEETRLKLEKQEEKTKELSSQY